MAPQLVLVKGLRCKKCLVDETHDKLFSYKHYEYQNLKFQVAEAHADDSENYLLICGDHTIVCPGVQQCFLKIFIYPKHVILIDTEKTVIYDHNFDVVKKWDNNETTIHGCSLTNDPDLIAVWNTQEFGRDKFITVEVPKNKVSLPIYHNNPEFRLRGKDKIFNIIRYSYSKFGFDKPYSCKVNYETL